MIRRSLKFSNSFKTVCLEEESDEDESEDEGFSQTM